MRPDDSTTIDIYYEPATAAHLPVTWTSTDPAVVSVDENGTITSQTEGKAIITAALVDYPEIDATCEVTVDKSVTTGLTELTVEDLTGAAIYDLSGRRIDARSLPHGSIVIVKSPSGSRKVLIK